MIDNDLVTTERIGLIVWLLGRGHTFTTLEVAHITGLSRRGAAAMMDKLSRKIPLINSQARWQLLTDDFKDGITSATPSVKLDA